MSRLTCNATLDCGPDGVSLAVCFALDPDGLIVPLGDTQSRVGQ